MAFVAGHRIVVVYAHGVRMAAVRFCLARQIERSRRGRKQRPWIGPVPGGGASGELMVRSNGTDKRGQFIVIVCRSKINGVVSLFYPRSQWFDPIISPSTNGGGLKLDFPLEQIIFRTHITFFFNYTVEI